MRVLVLSHMYPSTFNEVAGIFVHEQVKALAKKGVEVQVVSPVPWAPFPINRMSQKWKAYSEIPTESLRDGIKVWYPRYLTFPKGWFFASSGKQMYRGVKDVVAKIYREFPFDMIHAHVALPDGYTGALLNQHFRKPLLVTIHGQDAYVTIARNSTCKRNVEIPLKYASRVIVVSHQLGETTLQRIGAWLVDKMQVIGNGVNIDEVADMKLDNRLDPYVLTVGYLIKRKAHRYVIEAIANLVKDYPNLKYVIIGDGPERINLVDLAKELGIQSRVTFLGMRSHREVMSYMKRCKAFVLPSWDEAFGVVYIEAMANGKPVIGCKGEGIEDFVEHGNTGLLVKPRDVDSLVEALDFLLSHPDEAKAMGERARKLALENYTWEKNAEKTIKVYKEVLSGS